MRLLMWFQTGNVALVPLHANRFLEMMSETTVAWLLLEGAAIALEKKKTVAAGHPDAAFYEGKIAAALYYARNVLPTVELKAQADGRGRQDPDGAQRRGLRDRLSGRGRGRTRSGATLSGAYAYWCGPGDSCRDRQARA